MQGGKENRWEERNGMLFFSKSVAQCFIEAMEDLELVARDEVVTCIWKSEKEYKALPICYIKCGREIFRVKNKEGYGLEGKVPDGTVVKFSTARRWKGKHRWARSIEPVTR